MREESEKMRVSRKKWKKLEKRITDLEETVQCQQEILKIVSEAFTNMGVDINHLRNQVFQKQF